tara:strand:- start:5931 stop:7139 length:1209 start_codon:yes stop_codon:yes gene_type:complete
MPEQFFVQYINSDNKLIQQNISSSSASEVERNIVKNGGEVISVVQKRNRVINIQLGDPVKLQEKTNFIQQLKTMLSSGVSLVKGLEIASKQINNDIFKNAIDDITNEIKQGNSFSSALKKYPKIFDKVSIAMVQAGEKAGILDKMLAELEHALKKDVEINDNIKKATRYPKIVGFIMLLSMYVVIAKVIPTFTGILTSSGTEIPLVTKVLVGLGGVINSFGVYIFGILGISYGMYKLWRNTESGGLFFDKYALKNPIFKGITTASINLRFTKILGTLLSFGVPLKDALLVVKNVTDNRIYINAINKLITDINTGKPITESMRQTGIFSDYLCSMSGVGEEIGALDKMFLSAGEYYEIELKNNTDGLSALIEPIITVVMGLFIALFVSSVFLPMFKMYENVSL